MKRTDETRFSPDLTMTRTMQTTNLWRWKSSPKVYENSFTDVAKDLWYTYAVSWTAVAKIVKGTGDDAFSPDDTMTREQLIMLLFRYAEKYDIDTKARGGSPGSRLLQQSVILRRTLWNGLWQRGLSWGLTLTENSA